MGKRKSIIVFANGDRDWAYIWTETLQMSKIYTLCNDFMETFSQVKLPDYIVTKLIRTASEFGIDMSMEAKLHLYNDSGVVYEKSRADEDGVFCLTTKKIYWKPNEFGYRVNLDTKTIINVHGFYKYAENVERKLNQIGKCINQLPSIPYNPKEFSINKLLDAANRFSNPGKYVTWNNDLYGILHEEMI